jgi:SAM-dependent methyltransferase
LPHDLDAATMTDCDMEQGSMMAKRRSSIDWEQRYVEGNLPWDALRPDPHLVACVGELGLSGAALEIGCGTGTNAIWLAQQGFDTVALDIAPTAIAQAQLKAEQAAVSNVRFVAADALEALPVADGSVAFAFDRGCFHSLEVELQGLFAQRVAEALGAGGYWLSLCGNVDSGERTGPPQISAAQIVNSIESAFEIQHLQRVFFTDADGPTHLAWSCLARKRNQDSGSLDTDSH